MWSKYTHNPQSVRETLSKLKVGKGGVTGHANLSPRWEIMLHAMRNAKVGDDPAPYGLTLRHRPTHRQHTMGLRRTDVFTKSRSMWERDSVWRLTPETIDRVAPQIEKVMEERGR